MIKRTEEQTLWLQIESTPEMAADVYQTMERNLTIIRRRRGRPLMLADMVLLGHLDEPENQEIEPGKSYLRLHPDRVILQDAARGGSNLDLCS